MRGALLWDLDGTLVDSSHDLAISANAVRQHWALPPLPLDQVASYVGDGLAALLSRLLPPGCDLEVSREVFSRHYDAQCTRNTRLYAGVDAVLRDAAKNGWVQAVVSNKPLRWCEAIIGSLGIETYFPVIIGGDGPRKPAPDQLSAACERLGVLPAQAVMIGDHANDVTAAHAAGTAAVFVEWGFASLGHHAPPHVRCPTPQCLLAAAERCCAMP